MHIVCVGSGDGGGGVKFAGESFLKELISNLELSLGVYLFLYR